MPKPAGRIPRKTWSGHLELAATGRRLDKEIGTYGFLYVTHVDQHHDVPPEEPIDFRQIPIKSVELDIEQIFLTAFTEVHPPLTGTQEQQLLTSAVEIFPPLTTTQQQQLLDVLVEIRPPLTTHQQQQLFSGTEQITPPLTRIQEQQLLMASAEIVTVTIEQERRLTEVTSQIRPPLTVEQQEEFLAAVLDFFPTPERVEQILQVRNVMNRNTAFCCCVS